MIIELTVLKRGKINLSSVKMLFDTALMSDIQAEGTGTSFFGYAGVGELSNSGTKADYHVSESYAAVKSLVGVSAVTSRVQQEMWALFDGTVAGNQGVGVHSLVDPITLAAIQLPQNALITEAFVYPLSNLTSGTSMATVSLGCAVDAVAGIKAATLVSNAVYQRPAPPKLQACIEVETAGSSLTPLTAARTIDATVAVEAITAGKFLVLVRYSTTPTY